MEYRRRWRLLFGTAVAVSLIVQSGCDKKSQEASEQPLSAGEEVEAEEEVVGVRLTQSKSGSVLVLEEPEAKQKEPSSKDNGLSGRPARKLPAGYKTFRDQHVHFYAKDIQTGLKDALQSASAAGGRVITHPVKGFDNMGPNERTLVFDARTYPSFLKRLQSQGKVEHPEIGPCDYVTIRLTVLEAKKVK